MFLCSLLYYKLWYKPVYLFDTAFHGVFAIHIVQYLLLPTKQDSVPNVSILIWLDMKIIGFMWHYYSLNTYNVKYIIIITVI